LALSTVVLMTTSVVVGAPIDTVTGTGGSRREAPATFDGAATTVMASRPPRWW
jgi:hypothetical protein